MTSAITCEDVSRSEFTDANVSIRYHFMDNLRALAMIMGIFFHAALAFSPSTQTFWLTAANETSVSLDLLAWFSHLFRMPLFFVVAGFFCLFLHDKRGMAGMLKNRAVRILLPFVIFLPLVIAAYVGVVMHGVANVENKSQMMQFIAATSNNPDAQKPPLTTTHLWFLLNLVWFYIVFAVLQAVKFFESTVFQRLSNAKFILFVLPVLMTPGFAVNSVPHPAPEQFVPQLWSFGVFGLFFLMGTMLFRQKGLLDRLSKWTPLLIIVSVAAYAYIYSNIPVANNLMEVMAAQHPELTPHHVLLAFLEAVAAICMTIVCLIAGKRFLNVSSAVLRYVADASYWIYIIHLPVLFFIQLELADMEFGVWADFLIASFGTLMFGLISYALLVRWSPIGWLLNGRK